LNKFADCSLVISLWSIITWMWSSSNWFKFITYHSCY